MFKKVMNHQSFIYIYSHTVLYYERDLQEHTCAPSWEERSKVSLKIESFSTHHKYLTDFDRLVLTCLFGLFAFNIIS